MDHDSVVTEIIKIARKNEMKASQKIYQNFPNFKGVDKSLKKKLLPTLFKFLKSKNQEIQQDCAYYLESIAEDDKECTKAIIDYPGILPKLITLLSSPHSAVMEQGFMCLKRIADYFPDEIVNFNVLPPLIEYLKSTQNVFIYVAAVFLLKNISEGSEQNIQLIIEAGGIEALIKLLDSETDRNIIELALPTLTNIVSCDVETCKKVLDHSDALKAVKKLFNRVVTIVLAASEFLEKITSYGAEQINMVISESYIPLIINHIDRNANDDKIKIELTKIVQNIVKFKPDYIHSLINANIISILTNLLEYDCDDNLIIAVLTCLNDIIHSFGYEKIEQEFKQCGAKMKIQKLLEHENEEIQERSLLVYEFVGYDGDASEENDEEEFVEPPTTENHRKRQRGSVQINETITSQSKKSKVSMDQTDTENSDSPAFDKEELFGNKLDDLLTPRSSSPIVSISAAAIDARDFNNISTKPSSPAPSVVFAYPGDSITSENDLPRTQNDTIEAVKYYRPPESFIDECCKILDIQFDSDFYIEFFKNIKIKTITSNSKPATSLVPNDTSGFSCFSLFFTGTEEYANTIKEQTEAKFIDFMEETTSFDKEKKEKVKNVVFSRILKDDHIKTICQWLKCRIMVYCNGEGWQRFPLEHWNSEGKNYVPIFVLEKKAFGDSFVYEIVLTLKDE